MPVAITLDASQSHDPDGTVKTHRWLSGTAAGDGGIPLPGGMGVSNRWVPAGSPIDWPDDVAMPEVTLDMGIWSFTLWVIDDGGAISTSDTVKITIGNVVDPVIQACADKVVPTEPEACRLCVCGQSEKCRSDVASDVCDQTCWDLINCVASHCPDFVTTMDVSCLTMNCMPYLGGAAAASPAGACFRACPNDCPALPPGGMPMP
jgi:hypothetical protein